MSKSEDAGDAAFEEASAKLSKGLKTCRSVVENYRHMLVSEEAPDKPAAPPEEAAP